MMRALGYPRLISMENFRTPNFPLVAESLIWLVKRYDPNADLPTEIDTEQDRIIFIKSVAQFLATSANLKLNTKKLYMADGYAVREMLKISSLLYDAMRTKDLNSGLDSNSEETTIDYNFDLSTKLADLKMTRTLASDITVKGALVYDLLEKELDLREKRLKVLAKQLEIPDIEKGLKEAINKVEQEVQKTQNFIENVASDESNLEAKIEKKKSDLERNQKRLQTLRNVRPAFMDEYDKLEHELALVYEQYMVRFRCLAYLELQLEELERQEKEIMEDRELSIQKMVEKMRQDELLRTTETSANLTEDFNIMDSDTSYKEKPKRPHPASVLGMRRGPSSMETAKPRIFGSMTGNDREDSLESDSDLDLDGEDDDGSEMTDDDLEMEELSPKKNIQHNILPDSDNDF